MCIFIFTKVLGMSSVYKKKAHFCYDYVSVKYMIGNCINFYKRTKDEYTYLAPNFIDAFCSDTNKETDRSID